MSFGLIRRDIVQPETRGGGNMQLGLLGILSLMILITYTTLILYRSLIIKSILTLASIGFIYIVGHCLLGLIR